MSKSPPKPARPEKIRKELSRKRRFRLTYVICSSLAVLAVIGVTFSPLARIADVEVKGAEGKVDPELDRVHDLVGSSILWTDSGKLAQRIEKIAWVERVAVRKNYFRRSLTVEVFRRSPGGFVRTPRGITLFDVRGVPFEITDLPPPGILELTGEISTVSLGEASVDAFQVMWCAGVLGRWSKEAFTLGGARGGILFLVTAVGSEVRVGDTSDLEEKGRALRAMQERAGAEGWRVKTYNVVAPRAPALERA
ncbi:MAG: hypothetical protein C4317_08525 [Acidimicrobiia bacterium]